MFFRFDIFKLEFEEEGALLWRVFYLRRVEGNLFLGTLETLVR